MALLDLLLQPSLGMKSAISLKTQALTEVHGPCLTCTAPVACLPYPQDGVSHVYIVFDITYFLLCKHGLPCEWWPAQIWVSMHNLHAQNVTCTATDC